MPIMAGTVSRMLHPSSTQGHRSFHRHHWTLATFDTTGTLAWSMELHAQATLALNSREYPVR